MNIVVKILIFLSALYTQIEPPQGLVENAPSVWALQNARIHLSTLIYKIRSNINKSLIIKFQSLNRHFIRVLSI